MRKPDVLLELPKKLNEISGLEFISDSVLASVQDEKGRVYLLNANTGKVIEHFDFGPKGDYEGIAYHDNYYYVLRSDGKIYKTQPGKESEHFKFKNNKNFDFEGLCVDERNNQLLVACKTHGEKKKRDHIYIYSFSLTKEKYDKKRAFKIDKKEVDKNFKPSGIAIHPNGDIYVLSSFSKSLLVLNNNGAIKSHHFLDQEVFHQPEGITFNAQGDLFISNEKNSKVPTLLRFKK